MLIKLQEKKGYLNIKPKDIKRMIIEKDRAFGLEFEHILIYTNSSTEYVARYQERQDAEDELERFKSALAAGDEKFEFTTDEELVKKIDEAENQFVEETIQKMDVFKQEFEQKHNELYEQVKEQVETDNALTRFFCYIGALIIFCLTTYAGSRCIESPQLLVSAGIIAGAIGGALISHAMKCGKDD